MIFRLLFTLLVLVSAQDRPIGYGRAATGGDGGMVVTVSTKEDLKAALTASGPSIIVVTKDITFSKGDQIYESIVNKTLLGLKGVRLITTWQDNDGGILNFKRSSSNVIIRNLIFEGPGAYDVDGQDLLTNSGCIPLWVDHCEFYDGVDGNFDNVQRADNVTISWCKFGYKKAPKAGGSGGSNDHRFSNLVGGSSTAAPDDGHYSITFQYCYWSEGCKSRMPRARNSELHILNCYYNTSVSGAIALGLEGGVNGLGCYVEGTHFQNVGQIYGSYDGADSQPHTLTFVDCLSTQSLPGNIGTTPRPSYSYSVTPVKEIQDLVTQGAGATLDVSTSGKVGSAAFVEME